VSRPKHRKSKGHRSPGFAAERAEFWAVNLRTMQRWLARSVPVDDVGKMVEWYAGLSARNQAKLAPGFRRRLAELQIEHDVESAKLAEAELKEFEASYRPGTEQEKSALADLKRQFSFFLFKQQRCAARGDKAGTAEAMSQVAQLSSVIHDMELRAQKLGRDLGDLVPRKVLEDTGRFMGYNLLRCADQVMAELVAALTAGDPAGARLTAEEITDRVEGILLNAYVLRPIERAAGGDNPAAPPPWLVAALRAGAAEVLELPAQPIPQPTAV
jgi:hypothetical protein